MDLLLVSNENVKSCSSWSTFIGLGRLGALLGRREKMAVLSVREDFEVEFTIRRGELCFGKVVAKSKWDLAWNLNIIGCVY